MHKRNVIGLSGGFFQAKPGKFMVFHEGLQSLASQNGASQYPKTEKSVVFLKNIQKNANIMLNIAKKSSGELLFFFTQPSVQHQMQ